MANVFDGPNKRILIDSLDPNVDVRRLYSEWKEWVILSDNAKFEQAFRSIGGDPTIPGQTAPAYYFLENDWKVIVDGFDATFSFNLYSSDASSPLITQNLGTAQIFNSDVGIVSSTVEQALDYAGRVTIDTINGTPGSTYPSGTPGQPVNNLADAVTIAESFSIKELYVLQGTLNINQNIGGYFVRGSSPLNVSVFLVPGGFCANTRFEDVFIEGASSETDPVHIERCSVGDLFSFQGFMLQCGLRGTVSCAAIDSAVIWDCASQVPGSGSPTLDMRSGIPTSVNLRAYSGGLRVINCNTPDDVASLEFVAGRCTIESSCVTGNLSVRGNCDLVDNSAGTTVDVSAHMQSALNVINQGVQNASLLIPHQTNLP